MDGFAAGCAARGSGPDSLAGVPDSAAAAGVPCAGATSCFVTPVRPWVPRVTLMRAESARMRLIFRILWACPLRLGGAALSGPRPGIVLSSLSRAAVAMSISVQLTGRERRITTRNLTVYG